MLFRLLKGYARLAIKIYCRKIIINKSAWLKAKGPLLLACNHPNSFLDGMILTTLFDAEVYTLARGDAFRSKSHNRILRWLRLLPVYRTSEGMENLEHNYTTFDACREIFKQNGIVIIFSEGRCINEWHLRPLKKGTARLASSAWQEEVNLRVLPVGLNYNPFRNFGKNVFINFGEPLNKETIVQHEAVGKMHLSFNEQLREQLKELVFEISPRNSKRLKQKVFVPQPVWKKALFTLPAVLGFMLHAPLYFPAKAINKHYFDNDHFDSTLTGMLVLAYPFYLLLIFLLLVFVYSLGVALLCCFLLLFTAWACVQLKPQL